MKSIAFITRVHPKRPNMLKVCINSIKTQTSDDYIHILHRDDKTENGYGVHTADASLMKVKPINARYVMILDDDDMLIDPNFVEVFSEIIKSEDPEIIFFKGTIINGGIYPRARIWGRYPAYKLIASFCFAVRQDIWIKYIYEFAHVKPAGDFKFISRCHKETKNHIWLDRMVAQTQRRPGRGAGEHDHA